MSTRRGKLLVFLVASTSGATFFQHDPTAAQRARDGQAQLERITADPAARTCWAAAVEDLSSGCKGMDDGQRSKLAVQVRACAARPNFSSNLLTPRHRLARSSRIAICKRAAFRLMSAPPR